MSNSSKWQERVQELKENPRGADEPLEDPLKAFNKLVKVDRSSDMATFQKWLAKFDCSKWIYRGQSDAKWYLQPSLERTTYVNHKGHCTKSGSDLCGRYRLPPQRLTEIERDLLFSFQQQAHHYLATVPEPDTVLDWMSLMQHYGAPTRLLDWSKSPYVALYFAVEQCRANASCAVWAINRTWLEATSRELMSGLGDLPQVGDRRGTAQYLNRLLTQPENPPTVVLAEALQQNERMAAQQGLFLCGLDLSRLMSQVLTSMILQAEIPQEPPLRKIIIGGKSRTALLSHLRRMNIHSAALFPGLSGFARSLGIDLEVRILSEASRDLNDMNMDGRVTVG